MKRIAMVMLVAASAPVFAVDDADIYTLYRNSVLDVTMRIHLATFDSEDARDYNAENCFRAAELFQRQEGVSTRFWCEPGRFRK